MMFLIAMGAVVAVYALVWFAFLEPRGFDKSLYMALFGVGVIVWIRCYWRWGWGRWIYGKEWIWIPYYLVCIFLLIDWWL